MERASGLSLYPDLPPLPPLQGAPHSKPMAVAQRTLAAMSAVLGLVVVWPSGGGEPLQVDQRSAAYVEEADQVSARLLPTESAAPVPMQTLPPASTEEEPLPLSVRPAVELSAMSRSIDARPAAEIRNPDDVHPQGLSNDTHWQPSARSGVELSAMGLSLGAASASEEIAEAPPRQPASIEEPGLRSSEEPSTELSAIGRSEAALRVAGPVTPEQPQSPTQLRSMKIKTAVNMRVSPDNGARVVAIVPGGRAVDVITCQAWCYVDFDGKRGWVFKSFLSGFASHQSAKPPTPVAAAKPRAPCEPGWRAAALTLIRKGLGVTGDRANKGCGTE